MSKKNLQKVDLSELDKSNKFIIDWLSFSCSEYCLNDFLKVLGLQDLIFTKLPGNKGYRQRLYFDGININYEPGSAFQSQNNVDENRIWVEMSGQGCRNFETFSYMTCWDLLALFYLYKYEYIVNRIDIAYDCFDKSIDMDDLEQRVFMHNCVTRFKPESMLITKASKKLSHTIDLGSNKSNIKMRVYDKALERGYSREVVEDDFSWIRWEIQLRHKRCNAFIDSFFVPANNIGTLFRGIILNYFRPVVPDPNDSNPSRWDSPEWFKNFIDDIEKISLYVKADSEYNLFKCERYVYAQAGNALRTLIDIKGAEQVLHELQAQKPDEVPSKYQQLINESKTHQRANENDIISKVLSLANYLYLIKEFLKMFETRSQDSYFCNSSIRSAVLKVGKEEYYSYFNDYKDSLKQLSKENQLKYSTVNDDVTVNYDKESLFESMLQKYWRSVNFSDNLYIDANGEIQSADTELLFYRYIV